MTMENTEGARRTGTSRAAMERAAEYNIARAEAEKLLSDRYIVVQERLNELGASKKQGAKIANEYKNPKLDELNELLHKAAAQEITGLETEREELEQKMREKGMDPAQYAVSASAPEVLQ